MPMLPFKFSKSVNISRTIKNSIFKIWFWCVCGGGGGVLIFFLKILTHKKFINMLGFKKNDLNKILKLGQDFTLIKC
jgi:hypothetical protein